MVGKMPFWGLDQAIASFSYIKLQSTVNSVMTGYSMRLIHVEQVDLIYHELTRDDQIMVYGSWRGKTGIFDMTLAFFFSATVDPLNAVCFSFSGDRIEADWRQIPSSHF